MTVFAIPWSLPKVFHIQPEPAARTAGLLTTHTTLDRLSEETRTRVSSSRLGKEGRKGRTTRARDRLRLRVWRRCKDLGNESRSRNFVMKRNNSHYQLPSFSGGPARNFRPRNDREYSRTVENFPQLFSEMATSPPEGFSVS